MTDNEIRAAWRAAGGSFHGPHIETATMPEEKMFFFVRCLLEAERSAEREACAKVCDGHSADASFLYGDYAAGCENEAASCAAAIRVRSNAI